MFRRPLQSRSKREHAFHQDSSSASTTGYLGNCCCWLSCDGYLPTGPSSSTPQTGKRQQASLLGWRDLFLGRGVLVCPGWRGRARNLNRQRPWPGRRSRGRPMAEPLESGYHHEYGNVPHLGDRRGPGLRRSAGPRARRGRGRYRVRCLPGRRAAYARAVTPLHRGVHRPVSSRLSCDHREDFASDVAVAVAAHRESLNPPAWD